MRYALSYAAQQVSGIWSWVRDAGHVEKGLVRQTLGEAMEWLWKTYQAK